MGRPPKYQPLTAYLAGQSGAAVTLTFAEIEAIIGAPLPPGAYRRAFWTRRRDRWAMSPQAQAWLMAGWRVGTVGLREVTFVRIEGGA